MQWADEAIMLRARPQGENHAVAHLFTAQRGRAAGLVFGGQGKTKGPILQPGNGVEARFQSKRDDDLGTLTLELSQPRAATAMADRSALLGLGAVTDLLTEVLPEGNAYPGLYRATVALLDHLDAQAIWPILLAKWELGLLDALGFGLTLDSCAATGRRLEDGAALVFVSPKSGHAVSYEAGMPYKDKMLPLPPFLIDQGEPTLPDVKAALRLTGYFIGEGILAQSGKALPEARERYINRLRPT